jgi:hypothetical protein
MLGKPSRHLKKHLEEHGKKATATVVKIGKHGMAITVGAEGVVGNTTLELKTTLDVEPTGEPSFRVEKHFRYQQLAVPTAGMKVGVVYDPDDHDKIMLDDTRPAYALTTHTIDVDGGTTVSLGGGGGTDLGKLLADVRSAQSESGGDPQELAKLLRERLGAQGVVVDGAPGLGAFGAPQTDPLDRLEKLSKLHREGTLTDEEFAKAKAEILAEGV